MFKVFSIRLECFSVVDFTFPLIKVDKIYKKKNLQFGDKMTE